MLQHRNDALELAVHVAGQSAQVVLELLLGRREGRKVEVPVQLELGGT